MSIKYVIKAAAREYTDKNGDLKKFYITIGTVFETKHGLMMSLESMPFFSMKEGKLVAYLNDPEQKAEAKQPETSADLSQDIPF